MGESWKDRTVSLGNVNMEEFDSRLAHVTVSENRISVEFRDANDWKKIKREIGEESILKQVPWEDVEGVEKKYEHLYYPHVDVETREGVKRIYFFEDEEDTLESCFKAIKRFWNLYRESGSRSRNTYFYEGEEGSGNDGGSGVDEDSSGEVEESEDEDMDDVVEGFMEG